MVQFKKQNEVATLESQLTVSPQMAKLLKSHEKRVKAFIKDAKIECEHLIVDTTSILGAPITEGNATETISRLEEVHKKLLHIFEKDALLEEAQRKVKDAEKKAAPEEDFDIEKMKESIDSFSKKAKSKNIGVLTLTHNGTTGECRVFGTMPPSIAEMLLLTLTHEEG